MRKLTLCVLVAFLAMTAGCGKPKLNMASNFELKPGENDKSFEIEPIKTAQNIQVTGKTSGASINVYIYLKKNEWAAKAEIRTQKLGSNILASKEKTDTINLEAPIPANEMAVVYFTPASAKKADVEIKITN